MLEAQALSKRFGGVLALEDVSFSARAGRIHALLGENGAGKSTLLKCLSGVHPPDGGAMRLDGEVFAPVNPRAAESAGLRIVHQELNLVPGFTAAENVFLGRAYPRRAGLAGIGLAGIGLVDWAAVRKQFAAAQARFGLAVPLDVPVGRMSVAQRQMVEILRAVEGQARVLILDEPTASLSEAEAAALHAILRRLAAAGCTVVFVSHRIEEVLGLADDYSVLRNGRLVGSGLIADTDRAALLVMMAGEAGGPSGVPFAAIAKGGAVLELSGFQAAPGRAPVDLTVRAGEIVGIYGVVGSGRSRLLRAIWGAEEGASGVLQVGGRALPPSGIARRIDEGVAFASEDRRGVGLNMGQSVLDNAVLPLLSRYRLHPRLPIFARRKAAKAMSAVLGRLGVRFRRLSDPVRTLSGGNQQKVMIGRWLGRRPELVLLDEPTRGVDMRSKGDIHALCREITGKGSAVLFASSDIEEVLALATRVLVMAGGHIVADMPADGVRRHDVVSAALRVAGSVPAAVRDSSTRRSMGAAV